MIFSHSKKIIQKKKATAETVCVVNGVFNTTLVLIS